MLKLILLQIQKTNYSSKANIKFLSYKKYFFLLIFFKLTDDNAETQTESGTVTTQQQTDWSMIWECFENPHLLIGTGASKAMHDMVRGAVGEMRRYYSRKIIDVLVRVTRQSLEELRKRFCVFGKYSWTLSGTFD